MSGVETLRGALIDRGGTLGLVAEASPIVPAQAPPGPPQLAASGPRTAEDGGAYELLLEMILEGSLLHYSEPRVARTDDGDLGLLLGDQLFALGLGRLAELGDLDAVSELADVISLISQAAMAADTVLAEAVWEAGATAIGWGGDLPHEQAKRLARGDRPGAAEALRDSARRRRTDGPKPSGDAEFRS